MRIILHARLQDVVAEYQARGTGSLSSSHRMADWAIFAQITADALDVSDVAELLATMETERASFALENEPWAAVIGDWVRDDPEDAATWRKASSLVERLTEKAQEHDRQFTIHNAAGLGDNLSQYESELGELYSLEIDDSGRSNEYRFDVTDDAGTPTGLSRF
jgi:hypothetical protein